MFLIEYRKGQFINGETVQWVIVGEVVKFSVLGDTESAFSVESGYEDTFLNHLQRLNGNIVNIESRHNTIKKEVLGG